MKYIRKVIIEDFQSHKRTELELSEGFNVITGPSDQGKTAILRAIRWVLYNEPRGSDFIRVGANAAKVTLVMNDGVIVTRERSASRNRYVVAVPGKEEQAYEGFGHTVPEEVMQATGVRKIKIDEDNQWAIHLGMQLEPPFLLESNGALKAKAIGRMNGVHILDYAHRMMSSEIVSKQAEERRLAAEIEKVDAQLAQFADLDDWRRTIEEAERRFAQIEELERRIAVLRECREKWLDLRRRLKLADEYIGRLAPLTRADELWQKADELAGRHEGLSRLSARLRETRRGLQEASHIVEKTHRLQEASGWFETLEHALRQAETLRSFSQQKQWMTVEKAKVHRILERTNALPEAERKAERLLDLVQKTEALHAILDKSRELARSKRTVEEAIAKTGALAAAAERWETLKQRVETAHKLRELRERWRELRRAQASVERCLAQTGMLEAAAERLQGAAEIPAKVERLAEAAVRLRRIRQELACIQRQIGENEAQLDELLQAYGRELAELGRCPFCLGKIETHSLERILQEIG